MTYQIGYFVGSLSSTSINRTLSKALVALAPRDMEFTEIPIRDLPLYSPDHDADYPPEAQALKDALAACDAVLFVTPEYNRSIPGALKNAIDWASRPIGTTVLRDKPVAVMGVSPGMGAAARAQQQVRDALVYTGSCVMPEPELLIGAALDKFDDHGNVTDRELRNRVGEVVDALRGWAERIRMPERAAA